MQGIAYTPLEEKQRCTGQTSKHAKPKGKTEILKGHSYRKQIKEIQSRLNYFLEEQKKYIHGMENTYAKRYAAQVQDNRAN